MAYDPLSTSFPVKAARAAVIIALIAAGSASSLARNAVWETRLVLSRDVAEKSPFSSRAHNRLGNACDEAGLVEEALREYRLAAALNPGHVAAQINRGNALQKLGRLPEAVEAYRSALSLHPDDSDRADAFNGLGSAFLTRGRPDEALPLLLQARDLRPGSANILFNLGEAYAAVGSYDEAITSFTAAIALAPGDVYAYHGRGRSYERTGRRQDAIEDYQRAVLLRPGYGDAARDLRRLSGAAAEGRK